MAKTTIGKRLEILIKSMNLKQYEFAEKYHISKNSLLRYKGDDRYPDTEFLIELSKEGVNTNWLLNGEGRMMISKDDPFYMHGSKKSKLELLNSKTPPNSLPEALLSRTIILPVVGEISAGTPMEIPENYEFLEHIELPKVYLHDASDKYFVYRVNGESMQPQISHADIVVIHYNPDWSQVNDKICAVQTADGVTLKKVQLDYERQLIMLQPLNLDFKVLIIDSYQTSEVFLIGTLALQLRAYQSATQ